MRLPFPTPTIGHEVVILPYMNGYSILKEVWPRVGTVLCVLYTVLHCTVPGTLLPGIEQRKQEGGIKENICSYEHLYQYEYSSLYYERQAGNSYWYEADRRTKIVVIIVIVQVLYHVSCIVYRKISTNI